MSPCWVSARKQKNYCRYIDSGLTCLQTDVLRNPPNTSVFDGDMPLHRSSLELHIHDLRQWPAPQSKDLHTSRVFCPTWQIWSYRRSKAPFLPGGTEALLVAAYLADWSMADDNWQIKDEMRFSFCTSVRLKKLYNFKITENKCVG